MSEVWRETFCMGCGCGPSEPHHHNCATHEQDCNEGATMDRDALLTKLAMVLKEWPSAGKLHAHAGDIDDFNGARFIGENLWIGEIGKVGSQVLARRNDWRQRRAELINKPKWDDAPEWAKWLAQDTDGRWHWYRVKIGPPGGDDGEWGTGVPFSGFKLASMGEVPPGHDWRQTLEKRPTTGHDSDGLHYAEDSDRGSALSQALDADTGAHYRYSYKGINLDPYRIARVYNLGGGPREHMTKKLLRGTSKGGSERQLIGELRDALDRWEQMLEEDGE